MRVWTVWDGDAPFAVVSKPALLRPAFVPGAAEWTASAIADVRAAADVAGGAGSAAAFAAGVAAGADAAIPGEDSAAAAVGRWTVAGCGAGAGAVCCVDCGRAGADCAGAVRTSSGNGRFTGSTGLFFF